MSDQSFDYDDAINILAQQLLADLVHYDTLTELWERYPDIGEHDWTRVVDQVDRKSQYPSNAALIRAYQALARRADGGS